MTWTATEANEWYRELLERVRADVYVITREPSDGYVKRRGGLDGLEPDLDWMRGA